MTLQYLRPTRILLCSALLTLVANCGGRRFERESSALTTIDGEQTGSNSSVQPADAGLTVSDISPSNHTFGNSTFLTADGGLGLNDAAPDETSNTAPTSSDSFASTPSDDDAGDVSAVSNAPTTSDDSDRSAPSTSEDTTENSDVGATSDGTGSDEFTASSAITDDSNSTDSSIDTTTENTNSIPDCADDERAKDDHCYYFGAEEKAWDDARQTCRSRGDGWELVAIGSLEEHEWVSMQLDDDTWIGGFRTNDEWFWADTETPFWLGGDQGASVDAAFTWWEDSEPDAEGEADQCLRYSDDSGGWAWADMPCGRTYRYVCEG